MTDGLPRLSDKLEPACAASLASCWLPAPQALDDGAGAGISLAELDRALAGRELADWLPPELSRAVRKRQLSFLGGRLCAERALAALGLADAAVGRMDGGAPLWPDGMLGSITHHGEAAYVAAAPASAYAALGMDSERLARDSAAESIRTLCCTAFERESWLGDRADTLAETLIFSAKEAGYKAIHRLAGRYVDFSEFEVRELDWQSGRLTLAPTAKSALSGLMRPFAVRFRRAGDEVHTLVAEREPLDSLADGLAR
ncbi:4'-phosphopantetheinyl transferase family protein [Chromobacterium alticapitis]|uniref:Enterobactin synthase component D n=1 Tax=Chromobacterium alticapitis TaxID=2073169 RepID=A0A2S5DEH6_9NEIS|nr:4'-phosphopantetheinyl transferase superfamily protein [Chromobacterium alticapitis]POZ61401.1 hypothetical protein C2I19_13720 [Chromobacterium alticapitis]